MNAQKEPQLRDTYERFMNLMMEDLPLDELNKVAERDVMGYGTTIDERIFEIEGLRNIVIAQREQGAGMQISYDSKHVHNRISDQEDSALFVDEIRVLIEGNGMKSEIPVRITSLFYYRENTWKLVHWHGSVAVESEEDTWHLNKLKKKAEALEKLVTEKTADLIQKNRELEIEAALERVRNRTLLMKDSSELNEAVAVFFQQLKTLNLLPTNSRTYFCDIDAGTAVAKVWMTHSDGTVMQGSHQTPLNGSPSMISYFESWKRKEPILERNYTGETLAEYLKFLSGLQHVQEDKDYRQILQSPPQQIVMTDANFLQGNIGVMSFEPLSKEALSIMVRFAKLFEFTYTRFLDLQKAEAQAREAQIELGLERVRTKAMAMRDSDDLDEMIGTVFIELTKLDLVLTRCIIMIFDPDTTATRWWMANSEAPSAPMNFLVQAHENAPYQSYIKAWKHKTIRWQYDLHGKDKRDWDDFVFGETELSRLPDFVIAGMKAPERVLLSASFNNFGCLSVASLEPLSNEHFDILLRFAKVFDLTYTRYNDLKQAEEQVREAQIEAALERVRSCSLAMHKSEELHKVIFIVAEQIEGLGIKYDSTNFVEINADGTWEMWIATLAQYYAPRIHVPYIDNPLLNALKDAKKDGIDLQTNVFSFEEKNSFFTHFFENTIAKSTPEERKKYVFESKGVAWTSFPSKSLSLTIANYQGLPYSDEENEIFKRFANVFDQAYTRFLDLQKAEAQAREAQIQLALERVRTRTMAMQRSDELKDAAALLFQQVKALGVPVFSCGYNIWEKDEKEFTAWMTNNDGTGINPAFSLPLTGDANFIRFHESRQQGEEFYVLEMHGGRMQEHYSYLIKNIPVFKETFETILKAGQALPETQIHHIVNFSHGNVMFITFEPCPEAHDIFKRFGKVFEQTFTRFLDLKKAEAQAREAQIENALEKVRARTMAMRGSEELLDVASILFQQVKALGVPQWNCGFNIWENGDKEFIYYPGTPDGIISQSPCKIPLTGHPVFQRFDESRKRGDELLVFEKEGEMQRGHYQYMLSLPGVGDLLQSMLDAGFEFPTFQIDHIANFAYGNLIFITYQHFPEMHDVFKRFAKVFEQTYTRFLDLQKAEAQARESQIQLAMERVRARTMAMQKSDELTDAASLLFKQIADLGIKLWSTAFQIWNADDISTTAWSSAPDGSIQTPFRLPYNEDVFFKRIYEARLSGKDFFVMESSGKELEDTYHYMFNLPGVKKYFDDALDSGFAIPKFQITHCAFFAQGYVMFITYEPVPEAWDIFKRFAKVFEQTYTRFLDLQKAEAQAREARIESVLERVRSRTMAMQHSDELTDVAGLLFDQVSALGIKTWTAGFNVWSEDNNSYVDYITSPNGGFIEPYTVHTERAEALRDISNARKSGVEFDVQYVEGDKIKQLYLALTKLDEKQYEIMLQDGVRFPSQQYEHFVFGSKVSLMFITYGPVPEAHDIFKRLGKVFEQTYTRFLDLQKAEAQAREAQIQLSLERIRSKAMAMQHSDELSDFLTVLFEQFVALNLNPVNSQLSILDIDNNRSVFRLTGKNGATLIASQEVNLDASPVWKHKIEDWKAGHPSDVDVLYIPFESLPEIAEIFKEILEKLPPDERPLPEDYPNGQYVVEGYCKYGYLGYSASHPPSDEEKEITRRIANEFGKVYQRFLDLQKVEAQAREAQIQLSLERIRAKAMAMQHSDELSDFLTVLFEQFDVLNLNPVFCHLSFFDIDNNRSTYRMTGKKGSTLIATQEIDLDASPVWKQQIEEWKTVHPNDVDVLYIPCESFPQVTEIFKEILEKLPEGERPLPEDFPNGQYVIEGYCKYGYLGYSASELPSNEEKEITRRIANEFGNVYQRFLDLQKAEAQAREAQIENALEKVRSRTMAMQHSDELAEAAFVLFQQLQTLGVVHERINIGVVKEESKTIDFWITEQGGNQINTRFTGRTDEPTTLSGMYTGWKKNQKSMVIDLTGEDLSNWLKYLKEEIGIPFDPAFLHNRRVQTVGFFSKGMLVLTTPEPLPEENLRLLEKFAGVFDLTYTRFSDLKHAEAQAREAQVEVALERIRARALAMQSSTELSQVAKVLRDQMGILGQEDLEASVVHLYSEGSPTFDSWYAFRAGDKILEGQATFRLENSALAKEFLKLYEDEVTEYTIEVKGEKLKEWLAEIKRNAPKIAAYWGVLPPEKQFYHFSDFSGGALLMVSHENLTEETRMLQKRCASVFELAYKRFLDLESKERQERELLEEKQRLEQALSELKATQSQLIQSEKMASLGELTAGIAHEIKNPLNFVNNFSEVSIELVDEAIEERSKSQETRDETLVDEILEDIKANLKKVHEHGSRANGIVTSMLQHSRGGSGKMEPTDLNALIKEYVNLSFHGMRANKSPIDVDIIIDLDPGIKEVSLIKEDFTRVIINLCNNAFDAMRGKTNSEFIPDSYRDQNSELYHPKLTVRTKAEKDGTLISIADNGPGIPDDIKDKILQPFFTTKKGTEGTGLGLSITHDIVKAHGGELKVKSAVGEGTLFSIHLPHLIANQS